LKEANERYFKTVIEPVEGRYPPPLTFPAGIMQEQTIKEAGELIDPDKPNALHVHARPNEGWQGASLRAGRRLIATRSTTGSTMNGRAVLVAPSVARWIADGTRREQCRRSE
jgi:hypothetical protein